MTAELKLEGKKPEVLHPGLFSRYEHGGYPVWVERVEKSPRVEKNPQSLRYCVGKPEGTEKHRSARSLMIALHGGRDPHLTFDRYFRVGKWATKEETSGRLVLPGGVLPTSRDALLGHGHRTRNQGGRSSPLSIHPGSQTVISPIESLVTGWSLSILPPATRGLTITAGLAIPPDKYGHPGFLGINLTERGHEVGKILFKHFGNRIFGRGYDPDDVLQEIYKGIVARNRGKSPFDVEKSSFGHYVHMVCRCVLWNYERREIKRASNEVVGMKGIEDGHLIDIDASLAPDTARNDAWSDPWQEESVVKAEHDLALYIASQGTVKDNMDMALRVLPLMREGWTRQDMADHLTISKSTLNKIIAEIRTHARIWAS